ncbi:hypothetical protein VNO77_13260 [Canavalia gladiata]|uniref:C2 NT-type domain-containing protein n=1 Tax=Canavalia gladiata TaxID=3824 RepID=A0AAN9LXP8_CANGL
MALARRAFDQSFMVALHRFPCLERSYDSLRVSAIPAKNSSGIFLVKMVLGIRSKSRKSVSIQVHYVIHVQEIKPWPPSQSLRSVQYVLLQWENGDQNSGSLASAADNGKIEFNESFRLSVLMRKETSKKGKHRESFHKNYLEFNLYDKTVKSQLLGSATINLADFGIIKETKAISIVLNCKKSYRSSTHPFLFVKIQPFDTECSSSSPKSNLSKELSIDREESESASQSVKDDDIEIASFTDDDNDDTPSNSFQTAGSASETAGDNIKISERGSEGSSGEFVLPSENSTYSLLENTGDEASTQFNGLKSPSSSTILCSDMGNTANGKSSPKISEDSVKVANANAEIRKSIQQSSASYFSSSMKRNFERSSQSQVTQEDSMTQEDITCGQRFNTDALEKDTRVMEGKEKVMDKEKMVERRKGQEQFTIRNELLESELINNCSDTDATKKGKLNSDTLLLDKKSQERPTSILGNDKTEDATNVKFPLQSGEKNRVFVSRRNKNQAEEINALNDKTEDVTNLKFPLKSGEKNRVFISSQNKNQAEEINALYDKTENVTDVKFPLQSGEKNRVFISRWNKVQPEEINALNDKTEDVTNVKFPLQSGEKNRVFISRRNKNQAEEINALNDKTEDVTNVKFSLQSGENNGVFISSQNQNQAEEINALYDKTEDVTNVKFPLQSGEKNRVFISRRNKNQAEEINALNDKTEDVSNVKFPLQSGEKNRVFISRRNKNQPEEINALNDKTEDVTNVKFPLQSDENNGVFISSQNKKQPEEINASNDKTEDVTNVKFSLQSGENNGVFVSSQNKNHAKEINALNDETEDVTNVKFPLQSGGNNVNNQNKNQAEEINALNDVRVGTACHEDINVNGSFLNAKTDLKTEVENQAEEISALNDVHVGTACHEDINVNGSFLNDKTELKANIGNQAEEINVLNDVHVDTACHEDINVNGYFLNDKTELKAEIENQAEEINALNDVHVGAACHEDINVNGSFLNDKTDLKAEIENQAEELNALNDVHVDTACHEDINVNGSFLNDKIELKAEVENQAEEINALNDVHVDTACHEDINVDGSFLSDKTELKAEVEMLREELREAAALEVSMYSVIAEHGSSSNKVHAPARRLSRFYFHACRAGSPATIARAAQSAVSGFVLVSKACGNDVPRLTFWFSNIILLRAIVSKQVESDGPCISSECDGAGNTLHEEERDKTDEDFHSWEDPETFLFALEKVEAWIFSRIVESVWWQTLTPYMQSAAAKSSNTRKTYERRHRIGDQDQGSFSIDLWKRAFKDACERLCPLRTGGLECGCLPVIARLTRRPSVMEQLVIRLDVAMFNAILRESAEEMPTDPVSDPISDSKVLPIPAGKSSFGAGAQLKNAIGDWSRWLSDLFSIDDSDSLEVSNDNDEFKWESSFKPFLLLNTLSDLMMLPWEMLADGSARKEVCPRFGISLIKQVVNNFVPDEFSPGPIPDTVLEALNKEDIEDDIEGSITSFPCSAGSTFYGPPPASSVVGMLKEVGTQPLLKRGSFLLKKLYTSDDELDELDSPFSAIGMDDSSLSSTEKFLVKGDRKVIRYELLREAWKNSE